MKIKSQTAKSCEHRNTYGLRYFLRLYLLLLTLTLITAAPAAAQTGEPPNAAPPPVKFLSKDEKAALDAEKDLKKRTRLAIEMMEVRLKNAEGRFAESAFNPMFKELGHFHALMDLTLIYLNRNKSGNGKSFDTFKRFEMALRAFTPRIEIIRRELPESYEYYVRGLLRNVRETRAKAVEPLFGDSVVASEGN